VQKKITFYHQISVPDTTEAIDIYYLSEHWHNFFPHILLRLNTCKNRNYSMMSDVTAKIWKL